MRKVKINLILFLLCILWNCSDKRNDSLDQENQLYFNVYDWQKNKEISEDIIDEVQFIPLETGKENLIGIINKIIFYNGNYYIMDGRFRKDILVFNEQGKFVRSIGNFGKGAGELLRLGDFSIDKVNNFLVVLDNQVHKLLFFNIFNGEFVKEYKLDFWATNFLIIDESNYIFYSKDQISKTKHSIARVNIYTSKCEWYLEQDEYDTSFSTPFSLFQSENNYFTSYFKDVVYKISENNVNIFATFNFGKFKIPSDKLQFALNGNNKNLIELLQEKKWTLSIENFIENKDFIAFNFTLEGYPTFVVYSKNTANYYYGSRFNNELRRIKPLSFIAVDQNSFITAVDAGSFLKLNEDLEKGGNKKINVQINQMNILSKQSNPVLVLLKFNIF